MIQRIFIALIGMLVTAALSLMGMLTPQPSLAAEDVGAVVDLVLLPSSQTVGIGDIFDVAIQAQCNGQDVTGIAAFIDFDPHYLEVQSIMDGDTLTDFVVSDYDNVAGTIDYNAGTFTQPWPRGTFTVATIKFKAMNPDGNISLNFSTAFPRESYADFGGQLKPGGLYGTTITITGESTPDNENTPSELPRDNPEEPDTDSDSLPEEEENTPSELPPDNSEEPGTDSDTLPDQEENTSPSPPSLEPGPPSAPQSQDILPSDNDGVRWYIPASIVIGLFMIAVLVIFIVRKRSNR